MSQRRSLSEAHHIIIEIIKQVIEEKASRLEAKGFVYISSKEIYRQCLEKLGNENRCVGITTYAARFLNSFADRLNNSHRPRWRITTELLKKLYNLSDRYEDLKDIPLHRLSSAQFLYVVTSLLYEAKPEGEENDH